jgi:hypothetical protein
MSLRLQELVLRIALPNYALEQSVSAEGPDKKGPPKRASS